MNEATKKLRAKFEGVCAGLDEVLTELAGERVVFALIVQAGDSATYGSNADGQDVKEPLQEMIAEWDNADVPASTRGLPN